MRHKPNKSARSKWYVAVAALVAIAGAQLVFAGHQFEHDLDSIDDICAVCLQIERWDQPPCDIPAASLPAPVFESPKVAPAAVGVAGTVAPYSTRAPPHL